MKKLPAFTTLLFSLVLLWSCGTTQAKTSAGNNGENEDVDEAVTQQAKDDAAFGKVYNAYRNRLILSKASQYEVKKGDTLAHIAWAFYPKEKYGEYGGFYFPLIMLASSDVVLDPDQIEPGMHLTIPDIQENLDNPDSKAMLKAYLKDIASIYHKRGRIQDEKGLIELSNSL